MNNLDSVNTSDEGTPSIHLIWSCFVTNSRLRRYPNEKTSEPSKDRLYKFFTTLNSLKSLSFTRFTLYLKLDPEFEFATEEITEFIQLNFSQVTINYFRLETFRDWKLAFQKVDSDQILWLTYDDHALVSQNDSEFVNLQKTLNDADQLFPDRLIFGQLSHFPEMISGLSYFNTIRSKFRVNEFFLTPCQIPLGAVIVNTEKLKKAWKIDFTNGTKIVSPENPFGPSFFVQDGLGVIPRNELLRHLDGYIHVSLSIPFTKINMIESVEKLEINSFHFTKVRKFSRKSLEGPMAVLDSEFNSGESVLDFCANRLILANARRITYSGSRYTLSNVPIRSVYKIIGFFYGVILSKQLKSNIFYLPLDFIVMLILRLLNYSGLIKNQSNLIYNVNQIVSYRLLKYVGIKTSIRSKISKILIYLR